MKTLIKYLTCGLVMLSAASCRKDWLDRNPQTVLSSDGVMNNPNPIVGVLANLYDRLPTDASLTTRWQQHTAYDDAVWSGGGNAADIERNNIVSYATNRWTLWDFQAVTTVTAGNPPVTVNGYVRDVNLALDDLEKFGTELTAAQKAQFSAEFRFLRAMDYFQMVKRMGGVPIVTSQLLVDEKGDVAALQRPRNKESEVYDFIASECDTIKDVIGNATSNTRANKYAVLALKCRAMLYAGSIAKYNSLVTPNITLAGGEVGIPAARANEYYQKALDAAKEIMAGPYSLYKANPAVGENFYEALTKKSGNQEVILAQDFLQSKGRNHPFSYDNIARGVREDNLGSSAIAPSLNLVESFDYLDGSPGMLRTRTADNSDYIYYDKPEDIFANKDGRLYGTVIYPGTSFKAAQVGLQAGVMKWNDTTNSYTAIEGSLGSVFTDGKTLTGISGPQRSEQDVSNTGFNLRKYIDPALGSSNRGRQSDIWWVRFRLGEVYLNAAEAAFELGLLPEALGYINTLRERAGFPPNSLTSLTIDKLLNERRAELAFEDHRVWDLIRTRRAHTVWNGSNTNPNAMQRALYGYRVVRPGDPARHDKYIYVELVAPRFLTPRFFQIQNYYSAIPQNVIDANPKIIRNPFH